jgi:hypothetical protein
MALHCAVTGISFRAFNYDLDVDKPIHEMNAKYDGFFRANINDAGVARVEGLNFILTKSNYISVFENLHKLGAKAVSWRHNDIEVLYDAKTMKRIHSVRGGA